MQIDRVMRRDVMVPSLVERGIARGVGAIVYVKGTPQHDSITSRAYVASAVIIAAGAVGAVAYMKMWTHVIGAAVAAAGSVLLGAMLQRDSDNEEIRSSLKD